MTKTCASCREDHPLSEFTTDRAKPDGHGSYCRLCRRTKHAAWRARRPDLVKAGAARHQAKMTPEQKQRRHGQIRDRMRERYQTDPEYRERIQAKNRAAYAANPEPVKAAVTARYPQRKDKIKDYVAQRRAREAGARVPGEVVSRKAVFERDEYVCWLCDLPTVPDSPERRLRPSIDHVMALIDGGAHTMDNLRCAHVGCNCARYNRLRGRRPRPQLVAA